MRRALAWGGFAACALAPAALARTPALEAYTADAEIVERLERGKLVEVDDADFAAMFDAPVLEDAESTLVLFLVDAPAQAAWGVLTTFEDQPEFMPHMASANPAPGRREAGRASICFTYDVLWIESTNCFAIRTQRETLTLTGVLDPGHSDDRLNGVNYFWHIEPWTDGRLLMAYFQALSYKGAVAALGHDMLVGPKSTAKAVRERVLEVSAAHD